MKKLTQVIATSFMMCLLGLVSHQVSAQSLPQAPEVPKATDFTDDEYEKFVAINAELIPVQEEVQGKMMDAIKAEGMEVQRFQELATAQQQGKITEASEDPEEIATFNKAGQKVMEIQRGVQTKAQELIEKSDLSVQKFQEMSMAYNQSQEVKAKVDTLISKKMDVE